MKTLIVGLDGVPRRLLEDLSVRGVMPAAAGLIRSAHLHDLAASIPEISSVSWSSFMTGANPGAHGIFGFTDLVPGTLKTRFPRFADLRTPAFWDRLGAKGKRSVVLNQPSTYPARAIPGALVSGFVAPDLDRAVHPARHLARLRALGYRVDVDTRRAREAKEAFLADLFATHAAREEAGWYFWTAEEWDVFEFIVTGTDRLQHFLWDALEDAAHPLHARVLEYYAAVDATLGRLVSRFRGEHPRGEVYVLSDHGFTRLKREVRVNAWLRAEGYLDYREGDRSSLECLSEGTRAFALDPGRIHLRGVAGAERDALRDEIAAGLARLSFAGEPAIRAVHRREDIYHGPEAARGPDLVAQGNDGFDLKGTLKGDEVFAEPAMTGMHEPRAFLIADRFLGDGLDIAGVARFIEQAYE